MSMDEKRIEFINSTADVVNDGLDKVDASVPETLSLIEEIVRHCAKKNDEDPCHIAETLFLGMVLFDGLKKHIDDDVDHE